MTRETFIIILKAVLTASGSFLIGTQVLGTTIDVVSWEAIGGLILSGISVYWSIADKEFNSEKWQSFLRQFLLIVGGFIASKGWITEQQLVAIGGALIVIIPALQSHSQKKEAEKIKNGEVDVSKLASIPKTEPKGVPEMPDHPNMPDIQ